MIICIYLSNGRDVLGDCYKNIVNYFDNKQDTILVIPNAYNKEEFSPKFYKIIKENVSNQINKVRKLKEIYKLINTISILSKKYAINEFYIHIDGPFPFIFLFFVTFLLKKKYTIWLHDPILHEGTSKIEQVKRWIGCYSYLKFANKLVVSYKNFPLNTQLISLKNKFITIRLPQLLELEFEDIKEDKTIVEKYDFIFYGRIEKYKGLEILLDTFKDKALRNIKLLIVGRGTDDKKISAIVNDLENVDFINKYVPNRDLAKYIMQSRYVILPYRNATGTQTIQIANYYGKMVLSTKVGCFTEYINEGKNGFFIEKNTVKSLKNSIIKLNQLKIGKKEKELIGKEYTKFDIKRIANKLYDIITT